MSLSKLEDIALRIKRKAISAGRDFLTWNFKGGTIAVGNVSRVIDKVCDIPRALAEIADELDPSEREWKEGDLVRSLGRSRISEGGLVEVIDISHDSYGDDYFSGRLLDGIDFNKSLEVGSIHNGYCKDLWENLTLIAEKKSNER